MINRVYIEERLIESPIPIPPKLTANRDISARPDPIALLRDAKREYEEEMRKLDEEYGDVGDYQFRENKERGDFIEEVDEEDSCWEGDGAD